MYIKSKKIKISLFDKFNILIRKEDYMPFALNKIDRVKVIANFEKQEIYFFAAVKKDKISGDFKMMFSKQKQKELGLTLTDSFTIQLFEDDSKYGVEMPEELEEVFLTDNEAFQIFEKLTAGKKRSIIYGVKRFKTSQQKIDKALIMCENLKRNKLDPYTIFKL